MLLSSGPLPVGGAWCYELKWDGMRLLASSNGSVRLRSRTGRDLTEEFPELQELAFALGRRPVVLDGEFVWFDEEGKPDFGRLRIHLVARRPSAGPSTAHAARRRSDDGAGRVRLVIFDVLRVA